ncbi:CBS domain-containing protein [Halostella sp. PRR32]|uniref:CBS domain-containing protein n=1 Tax=Halostella sp. PRR32 TaxID=3098147 RepID=UPI002B1D1191|nr:CBS domain-containing protein [Halostella sp. PRR32]
MRSFRIGSLFGIPIKLDLTFLIILPIFAYLIGNEVGRTAEMLNTVWNAGLVTDGLTGGLTPWILGVAAALGLFVGVVLHELGHSLTAMHYGFSIDSITLWIFGGIASFTEMPEDWKQELQIAIAGPVVSVLVGAVCYVGFVSLPSSLDTVRFVLGYLALLNFVLAVFNMLPGFPMDGGRVLRALLARTRPYARATQIAAEVGKAFAILLGLWGLFNLQILLVGIAFFIYIGASSESQQVTMKAAFQDVSVRDLMTPRDDLHTVSPDTSVAELMRRMFTERHTGYPVVENGNLVGLVTLDDARDVREVERDAYTVGEVMSEDLRTVTPDTDAMTAINEMQGNGIGRLLVVDQFGDLVGLISRTDLMTAFNIIQETGSLEPARRSETAD